MNPMKYDKNIKFGWTLKGFILRPRSEPKTNDWYYFIDNFKKFLITIQENIFKKFHDNTTRWNFSNHIPTIDASKLTNAKNGFRYFLFIDSF
jgi:hypothetical protein